MQTATLPAFDVASVKISKGPLPNTSALRPGYIPPPPSASFSIRTTPQTLTILGATLMECFAWGYGVRPWQISAPDWFTSDRYDIVGRAAGPVAGGQLKLMLQHLLAERFRMAVRLEKRYGPVIVLIVDKSGPKFRPSPQDTEATQDSNYVAANGGVRFSFRNIPLDRLAGILSEYGLGTVVDMTGLEGGFDITWERPHLDDDGAGSSSGAGWSNFGVIQAALQKQLGLKLERRKAPIDYLVIDRASRIPTEN